MKQKKILAVSCFLCGRELLINRTKTGRSFYVTCVCGWQGFFRFSEARSLLVAMAHATSVPDLDGEDGREVAAAEGVGEAQKEIAHGEISGD